MKKRVFFDLETGGLDPKKHAIIQIAMIAVEDVESFPEIDRLELKLLFPMSAADPEALEMNCYDKAVWDESAVMPDVAAGVVKEFLGKHSTHQHETPKWQGVMAEIGGYNYRFDLDFWRAWTDRRNIFAPMWPQGLDVMELAKWYCWSRSIVPKSFSLGDVAAALGVKFDEAHDAMSDIEATLTVARMLTKEMGCPDHPVESVEHATMEGDDE